MHTHAQTYMCMLTCIYRHRNMHTHLHAHICKYSCRHTHMHLHRTRVCVHMHANTHACRCVHAHINIHKCTHFHTCTYTYSCSLLCIGAHANMNAAAISPGTLSPAPIPSMAQISRYLGALRASIGGARLTLVGELTA